MQNSNVSFTSKIIPVTHEEFLRYTSSIPVVNNVMNWNAGGIKKASEAYTKRIQDCVAGGIVNGDDVVMFHICPTFEENKLFQPIEQAIMEKIGLKKPNLQGFLIGSDFRFKESVKLFEDFRVFMCRNIINFSMFKCGKKPSTCHVAYKSEFDTWYLANENLSRLIKKIVRKIQINCANYLEKRLKKLLFLGEMNCIYNI